MVTAVAYTNFRKDLKSYLRQVNDDADMLLVTNKDERDNVVVMSASDYDSLMETLRVYQNSYLHDKVQRAAWTRSVAAAQPRTPLWRTKPCCVGRTMPGTTICIGNRRIDGHSNESIRSFEIHCGPHLRESANPNRLNGGCRVHGSGESIPRTGSSICSMATICAFSRSKTITEIAEREVDPSKNC